MAKTRALEKDAAKAIARAQDAIADARKAAKKLGKKTQARAEGLKAELEKASKAAGAAKVESKKSTTGSKAGGTKSDSKKSGSKKSGSNKSDSKQPEVTASVRAAKAKPGVAAKPAFSAPAPSAASSTPSAASALTPPLPHAQPDDLDGLSIIGLRTLAKSKGLTGYTRLPKAALVDFIRAS